MGSYESTASIWASRQRWRASCLRDLRSEICFLPSAKASWCTYFQSSHEIPFVLLKQGSWGEARRGAGDWSPFAATGLRGERCLWAAVCWKHAWEQPGGRQRVSTARTALRSLGSLLGSRIMTVMWAETPHPSSPGQPCTVHTQEKKALLDWQHYGNVVIPRALELTVR